jgi:ubiquinone/menaquinone biosynthesis C-methylase UbiE
MNASQPSERAGGEQRLFSQASFPEIYEQALVGPLFQPWVEPLLEEVELKPGNRVLDIACGTGIVARIAKERQGSAGTVVGVDLNPQMLAVARRLAPTIDWRQGDAGALPLRDGETFDIVLCQQGFQFFADRTAAVRQMHSVLVKGGRLGVSTWRSDEESPVLHELRRVAERHVGPIVDRRHSLGDTTPLEAVLQEMGFHDVRSKQFSRKILFQDGAVFVRLNAMALVSMSAQVGSSGDNERERVVDAIVSESAALVGSHTDDAGFAYEIGTNVVLARA